MDCALRGAVSEERRLVVELLREPAKTMSVRHSKLWRFAKGVRHPKGMEINWSEAPV